MARWKAIYGENEVDHSEGSDLIHALLRVEDEDDGLKGSIIKVELRKTRACGRRYYTERPVGYHYAQNLSEPQKINMIALLEERAKTEDMPAVLYTARKWAGMLTTEQSEKLQAEMSAYRNERLLREN